MPSNPLKPTARQAGHRAWHAQRPGRYPGRFSATKSARSPGDTCAISYEFNSDRGIPRANLLTGLGVDETFSRTDASGARHLLTDALGSTLALTDGAGAVQTRYSYEAYGKTTVSGTASSNSFEYTGRENDSTGLYFYRARYYNPGLQCFVSEDPIGLAGGPNVYAYVEGNPVSFVDPMGLDATIWAPGPNRSILDGPRNGNWGGGNWSGGIGGGKSGNAPPLDSGDACYQRHDNCYDSGVGKKTCDADLIRDLKSLPDDSKKWPIPPRPGTEGDSDRFRQGAMRIFGR